MPCSRMPVEVPESADPTRRGWCGPRGPKQAQYVHRF